MKRLARLQVGLQFLVDALKGEESRQFRIKEHALPDDAELAWSYVDNEHRLWLVVESASFTEVAEGDLIPELPVPIAETVRAA